MKLNISQNFIEIGETIFDRDNSGRMQIDGQIIKSQWHGTKMYIYVKKYK